MANQKKLPPRGSKPDVPNAVEQGLQKLGMSFSRPARIAALDIGESEAAVKRIDLDNASLDMVNAAVIDLKGTMSKAAARASERTGNTYTTESSTALTASNAILIFAVVTRTS